MEILYTRSKDGCDPVLIQGDVFTLVRDGVTCEEYKRVGDLLYAITGRRKGISFDKYFRRGRYSKPVIPVSLEDILGEGGWGVKGYRRKGTGRYDDLGVDLDKRGGEVIKILFAGFGGLIRTGGFEVDEVIQEIFQGIMIRNQGKCPFDPSKASFGHYVHMVCGCILNNYHRRVHKYRETVQGGGVLGWGDEGELELQDAGEGAISTNVLVEDSSEELALSDIEARLERGALHRDLAVRLLPLLSAGYSREECAARCGVSLGAVGKAIKFLRTSLSDG